VVPGRWGEGGGELTKSLSVSWFWRQSVGLVCPGRPVLSERLKFKSNQAVGVPHVASTEYSGQEHAAA
jgi:hypothetical protein